MAAAEYYNPGGMSQYGASNPNFHPQQQQQQPPQQQPQQPPSHSQPPPFRPQQQQAQQSYSTLPYPISDAPPPYTAYIDPQRQSESPSQQRPPQDRKQYPPQSQNGGQYSQGQSQAQRPQPQSYNSHGSHRPSFSGTYPPAPYQPQPQQAYHPQAIPAVQQFYANQQRPSSTPAGRLPRSPYLRDSRSRSRSRSRNRNKREKRPRPQMQDKKPSGMKTFLGAGGGALVGDLIFPGLGTIGGAILGGLGGHEIEKKETNRGPRRGRERAYSNDGDYYVDDHRRGRKH